MYAWKVITKYASVLHNSLHSIICSIVTIALDSFPDGVFDTIVTTNDKCYEIDKYLEKHHEGSQQRCRPHNGYVISFVPSLLLSKHGDNHY